MNLSPWDVTAGALIVEEAGGKVTDFDSGPDYETKRQIAASNGIVHGDFLRLVNSARDDGWGDRPGSSAETGE
jgi:myo-inositol-1(or 4)-monophosphatase